MTGKQLGKRVVIVGSPGAGKSYLSRELAKKLNLPVIHLDYYFHQADKDYLTNEAAWRKQVMRLAKGEKWIMEGNYKRTTFDIRFPVADTIIHLDYPSIITTSRVIKRRIQYRNSVRAEMPPTWKEKIDPAFFRYVLRYRRSDLPDVRKRINEYPQKRVVHLRSPKEAKKFLASL